jgi:hypothetical protein
MPASVITVKLLPLAEDAIAESENDDQPQTETPAP